jgi:hypothetical protein
MAFVKQERADAPAGAAEVAKAEAPPGEKAEMKAEVKADFEIRAGHRSTEAHPAVSWKREREAVEVEPENYKVSLAFALDGATVKPSTSSDARGNTKKVLVQDLAKAAAAMKMPLPDVQPVAIAFLFDGEPAAAEFCAKTAHVKLLPRLHALKVDGIGREAWTAANLAEALSLSVEDLHRGLISKFPGLPGCSGMLALAAGNRIIVAAAGDCKGMLLSQSTPPAKPNWRQSAAEAAEEPPDIWKAASVVVKTGGRLGTGEAKKSRIVPPADVQILPLSAMKSHAFVMLNAGAAKQMPPPDVANLVHDMVLPFDMGPKVAAENLAETALGRHTKATVAKATWVQTEKGALQESTSVVMLLRWGDGEAPEVLTAPELEAKKARLEPDAIPAHLRGKIHFFPKEHADAAARASVKRDMEEEKDKNNGMGPLAKSSMRAAKVNI